MGSNTGTWSGTLGSQWTTGKINGGGNFNGSNNYVRSSANVPITGNAAMTISIWVKFGELGGGYRAITDFGGTGTLQGFGIFQGATGAGSILIAYYGGHNAYTATGVVTTGQWYHLVAVHQPGDYSTTTSLYINGVPQSLTYNSSGTPNVTAGRLYAGSDGAAEYSNQVVIDEVGVWSRALSASEVSTLYNAGSGDPFANSSCGFSY